MTINDSEGIATGESPQGGSAPGAPVISHWGDVASAVPRRPLVDTLPSERVGVLLLLAIGIGLAAQLLFVGQGIGVTP